MKTQILRSVLGTALLLLLLMTGEVQAKVLPSHSIEHIIVSGSFQQMGEQYANQLGPKLQVQLHQLKVLSKAHHIKIKLMLMAARYRYTSESLAFIRGESESIYARTHHMALNDFILLDQSIAISTTLPVNCSFIGFSNTSPIIARNYDWRKKLLPKLTLFPIILTLKPHDKVKYPNNVTLVSNVGEIAAITYVNDKGLFLGLNSGVSASGNYQVWYRQSYFSQLFTEMFKVKSFSELKNFLLNTAPDFGYIINIAGPGKNQLLSLEELPFNQASRYHHRYKVRTRSSKKAFLVATNLFMLDDWTKYIGHIPSKQTSTFSKQRQENLTALATNAVKSNSPITVYVVKKIIEQPLALDIDTPGATEYLTKQNAIYSSNPDVTYYSLIYDTKNRILWVRFQQMLNGIPYWTPWKRVVT